MQSGLTAGFKSCLAVLAGARWDPPMNHKKAGDFRFIPKVYPQNKPQELGMVWCCGSPLILFTWLGTFEPAFCVAGLPARVLRSRGYSVRRKGQGLKKMEHVIGYTVSKAQNLCWLRVAWVCLKMGGYLQP